MNPSLAVFFIWAAASVMCFRDSIWPRHKSTVAAWCTVIAIEIVWVVIAGAIGIRR